MYLFIIQYIFQSLCTYILLVIFDIFLFTLKKHFYLFLYGFAMIIQTMLENQNINFKRIYNKIYEKNNYN